MRKILFVGDSLAGGGAERVMLDLLTAAHRSREVEVLIAVSSLRGELLDRFKKLGKLFQLGPYRGVMNTLRWASELKNICDEHDISCIVSNMTPVNKAVLRARMVKPSLPPVCVVEHTEIGRQFRDNKSAWKRFSRPLEVRFLYKQAAKVITVSAGIALDLQDYCALPASKFSVIHNPVDMARSSKATSTSGNGFSRSTHGGVVVSIGRLEPVKNYQLLIAAFASVVSLRGHTQDSLYIFGDGHERDRLQALVDTFNLREQVFLMGFQDNIFDFLGAADVFVSTSLYEGLGNAMLESIAAGCPIIATDTNGSREIAKHVGCVQIVNQGKTAELAAAIYAELTDPKLRVLDNDKSFIAKLHPDEVLVRYLEVVDEVSVVVNDQK